ncbi:MAG: translation initiation factor IF-2 [Elainellaceae cyanobacterium]
MSNDKVRIYELSKELNVENKDVLAICNELNIAAKSHSSTITESEAGQIRKASAGRPVAARPSVTRSQRERPEIKPKAPPTRKPQILELRKRNPSDAAPSAPQADKPVVRPQSAELSELSPAPPRPIKPSRPGGPSRSDRPAASAPTGLVSPNGARSSGVPAAAKAPGQFADSPAVDAVETMPVEVPSLVSPPVRPQDEADYAETDNGLSNGNGSAGDVQSAAPPPIIERPKPVQPTEAQPDTVVRLAPPPKLRRPVSRPVSARAQSDDASSSSDGSANDDGSSVSVIDDISLLRPSPMRPKRDRKKEVEEEDEQEIPKRKAVRPKRRDLIVDDDDFEDEDGDSGDADQVSAEQMTLSMMRPPKPKSFGGATPKPAAAKRKPAPSRPSQNRGSSSQGRRDRREQEQAPERPEIIGISEDGVSVHELAEQLMVPETDIIKTLFFKGIATNINQILDVSTAAAVGEEYEVMVEAEAGEAEAKKVTEMIDESDLESLVRRPPVVTIMGHVDHGKTTLLDSIRQAKVAQGEAGGITQHIGAYHVDVPHGDTTQQIVFLDTPGHEAFTAMRARGARVTDIAVLVVAADDGVRPQTIEAIRHAQAAEVPIVVAINKVDKEQAQPDRVKQELMEYSLVAEEWGGDTIMVPVSALKGENLDTLLEMLLLVSDVEDLNANPDRNARGTIIEANLDKARGPVATLLVQNGTLHIGDVVVAGSVFGKVRAMIDDRGDRVSAAAPSFAVEVLGLNDVPAAGEDFEVFSDEKEARSVADSRADAQRQSRLQQTLASRRVSLNTLSSQAQEGELKELNLLIKADVQGSLEAILASLQQLPQDEVQVRVLLSAPGEISETDVDLAAASGAVIIGFNTTLASGARQAADQAGVDIREYDIIYKLLEDIQGAMEGLLEPEMVEEPLGQVEVRAVFTVGKGSVAGCYVQSGKVVRNCRVRVQRGGNVAYEGGLDSLKRMKDDVKEVNSGYECGIGIDKFNGWEEGDIVEAFRLVSKRRTLTL